MKTSRTAGSIVVAALFVSLLSSVPSPGISSLRAQEGEVTLAFNMKEGDILKYKGTSTTETNFKGFLINSVHHDDVELSFVEVLEDRLLRIAVKYVDCSDRRSMGGAAMSDFDSPIKPKGKTIKIVVRPTGRVEDVQGFIMGINSKTQLERYVAKWILELPEGPVTKGSKWTREVPREGEEVEGEEGELQVTGTVELELKKFGEEDGIPIVEIETKGKFAIHSESAQGIMDGKLEIEGKYKIAIDGGYIVKGETSSEMTGEMIATDVAGKESSSELSSLTYEEIKLEK